MFYFDKMEELKYINKRSKFQRLNSTFSNKIDNARVLLIHQFTLTRSNVKLNQLLLFNLKSLDVLASTRGWRAFNFIIESVQSL